MKKSNFHNSEELSGVEFLSSFTDGSRILARYEAPKLTFDASRPAEHVQQDLEHWNEFIRTSYPGNGYYAADPMADSQDSSLHHFILFADNLFIKAFLESVEEVDISTPAEEVNSDVLPVAEVRNHFSVFVSAA